MPEGNTVFVAAVFVLAGLVKGVIGLGLPTISMGLLALVMTPLEAAAILILPSFVTNIWQMVAGGALTRLLARLWPMMLAVVRRDLGGERLDEARQRTHQHGVTRYRPRPLRDHRIAEHEARRVSKI